MSVSDLFLGCFAFGLLWSLASLILGGFHTHSHMGHASHGSHPHGHGSHGAHSSHGGRAGAPRGASGHDGWAHHLFSFHTLAIFLAWMGGCGYLMTRHTIFGFLIVALLSSLAGIGGAFVLASVLRFLHQREFTMDDADYDMVGVLGRISSPIRQGGTGEMIFVRDGGRKLACVRSEAQARINRDEEVVVTSYRNGIAYVRTWAALTEQDEARQTSPQVSGNGSEDAPAAHR